MTEVSPSSTLSTIDPVCGMTVHPDRAKGGSFDFAGTRYFFCNPKCREKFSADPAKYLAPPAPAPAHAKPVNAAAYVCPMDPEVRSDKPGACPKCGMALEPESVSALDEESPELIEMRRRFFISLGFTLPLFVLGMSDLLPGQPVQHALSMQQSSWLQLALSAPVVLWGGYPFFERGLRSVVHRSLNMFTLIALGTASAFGFSVFATLDPGALPHAAAHGGMPPVYFEASGMIVTLALLGQWLELRARSATSGSIRSLLRLTPKTTRRIAADGGEAEIPLSEVAVGDQLRVRPGEHVPVDGVVLEGASNIDESMLSGEAMPVEKRIGSALTGGTLNGHGALVMQARRVGGDTLLSRIVAMVSEAQRSRAPIQRVADAVSAWFVPAVIAIALLTALVWWWVGPEPRLDYALVNAVSVLIIACPCALGLATPMSIMVGTGRGAQLGVLIKNAEALQLLERIDTLVVDKTGTLTEGKPKLVTLAAISGGPAADERLLAVAAALEQASEHPLAAAIVAGASERGVALEKVSEFRAWAGEGITGRVGENRVALGNARLFERLQIELGELPARAEQLRSAGQIVVFVALDEIAAGLIGVVDPIKDSARNALRTLRAAGLRVVMLSGDSLATAQAVASQLGIDEIHAEVLPEQKAQIVSQLRAAGRHVAMAGDGTNDAPALARAEVGIAMGTGTDVAVQSADITLLKGDLDGIVRARGLSRQVMHNIRQNLFFALIYNALGVPIAAGIAYPLLGVLLNPMLASAAMAFSSVSVIANALRLRHVKL